MGLPAPSASAALLASATILFNSKRQSYVYSNIYAPGDGSSSNSSSSSRVSHKAFCETSTFDNSTTTNALSSSSYDEEESIVPVTKVLEKVSTHAEVFRRFVELSGRSAVALLDYKLFYFQNGELNNNNISRTTNDNLTEEESQKQKEYNELLSQVHKRSAISMYNACLSNGGILIKLGQYISNLAGFIPEEYLVTLRPLQDSCKPVPIDVIRKALEEELSPLLSKSSSLSAPMMDLKDIEIEPLGSASLAQVHKATLKDGRVVAIKVQRPGLEASTKADIVVLQMLSKVVDIVFPGSAFDWLLPEFHQTIAAELDFTQEARNMQRCSKMLEGYPLTARTSFWRDWFWPTFIFKHSYAPPKAIVPIPIEGLTTKKVLTMTYEEGFRITNHEKLEQNEIQPRNVATAACALFADLTFRHGFVHADPHPGNILVRPRTSSSSNKTNKGEFDLVLLDHGMYRRLEHDFRLHYSQLWAGLVSGDYQQALEGVRGMGLEDKYLDVFGIMLVYRLPTSILDPNKSIFAQQRLGSIMNKESRKLLRKKLEDSFGENVFSSSAANSFMESLPRDLLFCLRCNNLVRGLNRTLGGSTLDRFVAFGSSASLGSKLKVDDDKSITNTINTTTDSMGYNESISSTKKENKALRRAKELLNRPVASEIFSQKNSSIQKNEIIDTERIQLPSLVEFLESYKVGLRVWAQCLFLDFLIWYRGKNEFGTTNMNLG